jgi:DivIVA domain-containing protein
MPLTADDVNNVVFQTSSKRKAGYDEDEVDAFLDQVAAELTRLGAENDSLRAQLATRPAAGPAAAAVAAPVAAAAPTSGAEQAARRSLRPV